MMNEETIFENKSQMNESTILGVNENINVANNHAEKCTQPSCKKKNGGNTWIGVTLGGVSGILMGAAGLMYAQKLNGEEGSSEVNGSEKGHVNEAPVEMSKTETSPEDQEHQAVVHHIHHFDHPAPVAEVGSDLPFGEAFDIARAEVGPGGVFCWNGGVYSTFTAEEWDAMTPEERADFAQHVPVAVPATSITTPPTDTDPDIVWEDPYTDTPTSNPTEETDDNDDFVEVDEQTRENFDLGDDVHVVGFAKQDGHLVAAYDHNDDGEADFAIIDIDNDHQISGSDIIMYNDGNYTTVSELSNSIPSDEESPNIDEQEIEENAEEDGQDLNDNNLQYTSNEDDVYNGMSDNDVQDL